MDKRIIMLTPKQKEQLAPLFKEVDDAYLDDKKGAIFGQVWKNSIECKFLKYETCTKIMAILEEAFPLSGSGE